MSYKKQDKSKIVQIWGDILDEGFTSVPNLLLRYRSILGIKPQHLSLIIDIMSFKWDVDNPFPSYITLATRAGVDERSIKRITQDLEELGLLIKEPRFDDVTGAQITTIFDFRPLVRKLTEERVKKLGNNLNSIYSINNVIKGGDKNVIRGGDKNVTGGVTKNTLGGVTKMSPKKYSYINKTNINKTTYSNDSKKHVSTKNYKDIKQIETVHTDFKKAIYKKRLYETHDNLIGIKPLDEVVEEGIYKALKDVFSNRAIEISKKNGGIDLDTITSKIKQHFPYTDMPSNIKKSRQFYVETITNMIINELS